MKKNYVVNESNAKEFIFNNLSLFFEEGQADGSYQFDIINVVKKLVVDIQSFMKRNKYKFRYGNAYLNRCELKDGSFCVDINVNLAYSYGPYNMPSSMFYETTIRLD